MLPAGTVGLPAAPVLGAGWPGVTAPAKAVRPPGDELVESDGLAPDDVERVARDSAGRPRDNRAQVGMGDQVIHVNASEDPVQVHPVKQPVDVDPVKQLVDIDPVEQRIYVDPVEQGVDRHSIQQRVHIQGRDNELDDPLRHELGQRLGRRGQPVSD